MSTPQVACMAGVLSVGAPASTGQSLAAPCRSIKSSVWPSCRRPAKFETPLPLAGKTIKEVLFSHLHPFEPTHTQKKKKKHIFQIFPAKQNNNAWSIFVLPHQALQKPLDEDLPNIRRLSVKRLDRLENVGGLLKRSPGKRSVEGHRRTLWGETTTHSIFDRLNSPPPPSTPWTADSAPPALVPVGTLAPYPRSSPVASVNGVRLGWKSSVFFFGKTEAQTV